MIIAKMIKFTETVSDKLSMQRLEYALASYLYQ